MIRQCLECLINVQLELKLAISQSEFFLSKDLVEFLTCHIFSRIVATLLYVVIVQNFKKFL